MASVIDRTINLADGKFQAWLLDSKTNRGDTFTFDPNPVYQQPGRILAAQLSNTGVVVPLEHHMAVNRH